MYNSIIESIANGASKLNEIATKVGEASSKCSVYIKTLIELQIIEKKVPTGEKETSRKEIYSIKDNLFKFWYRFAFNYPTLIEQEMIDYLYKEKIEPEMNHYIGYVFEKICIDYLIRKNKEIKLPFVFEKIGSWWGNNPIKKCQEEIDILAISKEKALIGECKWRNKLLDIKVVMNLIEKSQVLPYKEKYYVFFSKSGFTKEVIEYADKNEYVYLYDDIL